MRNVEDCDAVRFEIGYDSEKYRGLGFGKT